MKRTFAIGAVFVVMLVAAPVRADDEVDQLIKQVVAGARSNADRAGKLYEAAQLAKETPKIQVAMLLKSVEYGMKGIVSPEARKTVQDAIAMLGEAAPKRADEWRDMNLNFQRRWFRLARTRKDKEAIAGRIIAIQVARAKTLGAEGKWSDATSAYREAYSTASMMKLDSKADLARYLRSATHMANVAQKVARYESILKAKPDHATTRTLLLNALVVDLDAPDRAVKHLNDDVDQAYRTYIPLATKEVGKLPGDVSRELGDWYYKALSPKAASLSKPAMLVRAQTYYQQFLDAGSAKDVSTLSVKMTLAKIDKDLEKLAAAGTPAVRRDRIIFHAKQSMSPFKDGKKFGSFPVQKGANALSPFVGSGIYFDQKTGKDVYYEIFSTRRIKSVYYKGAAIFNTHIQILSPKGKVLATMGPLKGGNSWAEFTLELPSNAGNHVFLKFRNDASTWFYINTITLKK